MEGVWVESRDVATATETAVTVPGPDAARMGALGVGPGGRPRTGGRAVLDGRVGVRRAVVTW